LRWYTLPGWPARVNGHAAAMPIPAHYAGDSATAYKDYVTGHPGTVGVRVQPVIPSPDIGDKALAGLSRSEDAPDMIYPNLYWQQPHPTYWPGAGMAVSVRSDNMMPVPATDPRAPGAPLQVPIKMRGNKQIGQPAALVQWPVFG
jgi:hypothetical protein